ncbi:hypothetical protein Tco_0015936 [Tanacetum coccineum]
MPEQMLVGEFLPPYYISQLGDSIIISGSFNFGDFRIIYAWELEVDDGELGNSLVISGNLIHYENRYICAWLLEVEAAVVTSWRVLFVIPSQNIAKLLGFTMDDDLIVEVDSGQEMVHTLQVYDRPSQQFHNVGIEGDVGSFFIGPYKESLILLNV